MRSITIVLSLVLVACEGPGEVSALSTSFEVVPSTLAMGDAWVGHFSERAITLTSVGNGSVTLLDARSSDPAFVVVDRPGSLSPDGVTLVVRFEPSEPRAYQATLELATDADEGRVRFVALAGMGREPPSCDDDNPCTDDNFEFDLSSCSHSNRQGACDDDNACTVDDVCTDGRCLGSALACDDGVECTADTCDPERGCTFEPVDARCDDGNPCTSNTCAESGCTFPTAPDFTLCGAYEACDFVEGCFGGQCVLYEIRDGDPCSDGDICSLNDTCAAGECVGGPIEAPSSAEPQLVAPNIAGAFRFGGQLFGFSDIALYAISFVDEETVFERRALIHDDILFFLYLESIRGPGGFVGADGKVLVGDQVTQLRELDVQSGEQTLVFDTENVDDRFFAVGTTDTHVFLCHLDEPNLFVHDINAPLASPVATELPCDVTFSDFGLLDLESSPPRRYSSSPPFELIDSYDELQVEALQQQSPTFVTLIARSVSDPSRQVWLLTENGATAIGRDALDAQVWGIKREDGLFIPRRSLWIDLRDPSAPLSRALELPPMNGEARMFISADDALVIDQRETRFYRLVDGASPVLAGSAPRMQRGYPVATASGSTLVSRRVLTRFDALGRWISSTSRPNDAPLLVVDGYRVNERVTQQSTFREAAFVADEVSTRMMTSDEPRTLYPGRGCLVLARDDEGLRAADRCDGDALTLGPSNPVDVHDPFISASSNGSFAIVSSIIPDVLRAYHLSLDQAPQELWTLDLPGLTSLKFGDTHVAFSTSGPSAQLHVGRVNAVPADFRVLELPSAETVVGVMGPVVVTSSTSALHFYKDTQDALLYIDTLEVPAVRAVVASGGRYVAFTADGTHLLDVPCLAP